MRERESEREGAERSKNSQGQTAELSATRAWQRPKEKPKQRPKQGARLKQRPARIAPKRRRRTLNPTTDRPRKTCLMPTSMRMRRTRPACPKIPILSKP